MTDFKVTVAAFATGETRAHGITGEVKPVARFEGDKTPAFDECVQFGPFVCYYRIDATGEGCLCASVAAVDRLDHEARRLKAPESTQGLLAGVAGLTAMPVDIVAWIDKTPRQ